MFSLAWDLQELKKTHDECRKLISELSNLSLSVSKPEYDIVKSNVPSKLSSFRETLQKILKAIFWYKRKPATHAFVFMIASDRRDMKPYALPVQCIPCAGLTSKEIRRLTNELIGEMVKRGMRISGTCSVHIHVYVHVPVHVPCRFSQ